MLSTVLPTVLVPSIAYLSNIENAFLMSTSSFWTAVSMEIITRARRWLSWAQDQTKCKGYYSMYLKLYRTMEMNSSRFILPSESMSEELMSCSTSSLVTWWPSLRKQFPVISNLKWKWIYICQYSIILIEIKNEINFWGWGHPHFTSFGQPKKAKLGWGKINLVFWVLFRGNI